MLELYLIRHAESEMNLKYSHIIGGRSNNTPLTPNGCMQSELLGKHLNGTKFDAVYSSTALRAISTANISSLHTGIDLEKIIKTDKLLELSQGRWQGLLRKDVYTPGLISYIEKDPLDFRPPEGESPRDVENRMLGWVNEELLGKYDTGTFAAYSHGMAIKCLLHGIMGFHPYLTRNLVIENTSITRLQYLNDKWLVHSINDTAHLASISEKNLK